MLSAAVAYSSASRHALPLGMLEYRFMGVNVEASLGLLMKPNSKEVLSSQVFRYRKEMRN